MQVFRRLKLLNVTQNPGELVEDIASISYRTQRFYEKKRPKIVKFKSGRTIPFSELGLSEDPIIGEPLPGYKKDDVIVTEILQPSWVKVVKFLFSIGHHSIFRCCNATFLFENITRKSALHFLRYQFCHTNMQSQKYKNQGDFEYVLPDELEATFAERLKLQSYMTALQNMYNSLKRTNLDAEWMRSCYPNNIAQTMTFSTNFEQLRHMCDCLCGDDYVSENRDIMMDILKIMKKEAPVFFYDFIISEDGKSARRKRYRKSRNKQVNWTLPVNNDSDSEIEMERPILRTSLNDVKEKLDKAISKIPNMKNNRKDISELTYDEDVDRESLDGFEDEILDDDEI